MTKKYKFTKEAVEYNGHTLRRIVATRNFGAIRKGDLGGFIETKANLSHDDNCWVFGDARVCDNALVYGDARVCDNALVYGSAKVYDNAYVYDNAKVYGDAWVCGNAQIKDQVLTTGYHTGAQAPQPIKEQPKQPEQTEVELLRQENKDLKEKLEKFFQLANEIKKEK